MKRLTSVLVSLMIVLLFSLLFSGCWDVRLEKSEILHEEAVVVEAVYTPSHHDSELNLTMMKTGPLGMDYNGDFGIRIGGGLQISDVHVPEKFAVVFKCKHGKFIVSRKEIYEKLKDHENSRVDVTYREIYWTTYEDDKVKSRELRDFDFLDANLK